MTLSGATTPGQSGRGSDGNKGGVHIPQSSSITGTLPSDCLVSYPGHSLGGGRSSQCILQPQPTGQGKGWGYAHAFTSSKYDYQCIIYITPRHEQETTQG